MRIGPRCKRHTTPSTASATRTRSPPPIWSIRRGQRRRRLGSEVVTDRDLVLHFLIGLVRAANHLEERFAATVFDFLEEHAVELVVGHAAFFEGRHFRR